VTIQSLQLNLVLDAVVLVLSLCIVLILRLSYGYVKTTVQQLTGVQDASMEALRKVSLSCLPGFKLLFGGFTIYCLVRLFEVLGSWRELQLGPDEVDLLETGPLRLLLAGAALSAIASGFILYIKAQEENKPVHLWRPFDRVYFQNPFPRRFQVGSVLALAAAVVLAAYWGRSEELRHSLVVQAVFGVWHLVLLGIALLYVRRSNVGIQGNLTLALAIWVFAAVFTASGQLLPQKFLLALALLLLIRLFVVDNVYRLSDLGVRSAKLSHDRNVILSFLTHVAASGDDPKAIEGSFDVRRLMQTTLEFAMKQTQAAAGAIFLASESTPGELLAVAVRGSYPPQKQIALSLVALKEKHIADLVLSEHIPVGEGVVGEVAATGKPLRIKEGSQDSRIPPTKDELFRIHNQLAVPLKIKDRVEGVLSVINRAGTEEYSTPFDVHDEALLLAVWEQAAIAMSNARMHKILAEQEILEREIQIAQEVQQLLLPKTCPQLEGFDIEGFSRSARRVGGDYYDFLWMDDHRLAIVIADVAGKGVPGALTMAMVRSALKAQVHQKDSAREILTEMNEFVYQDTKAETFVSMFLAVLDIRNRTISLARAGHEPLIYLSGPNGTQSPDCQIVAPNGIALGMEAGGLFLQCLQEVEMNLKPGDTLVFYTDGITEAMNDRSEEYSIERFIDLLKRNRSSNSKQLLKAIDESILEFTGDLPQHDDLTLVLLKVKP